MHIAMKDLNGQPLHFKVYDLVSKIHIESANGLKELYNNYYKTFENLILNLKDKNELYLLLVDFVKKHGITNIWNLNLYERMCYVQCIIAFLGTRSISFLSHIFKYYESHKDEFGQQIEKCMIKLQTYSSLITLVLVVVVTLRPVYLEILEMQKEIDKHSSDTKKLLAVAKQLVNSEMTLKNFLLFVINWVSQSNLPYHFFYFMRPFIDLRSPQAINEALLLIENKIKDFKWVNTLMKAMTDPKKTETEAKHKVTNSAKKVMAPLRLPITIKQRKPKAKKPEENKLAQNKTSLGLEEIEKKFHKAKL